MDGVDYAHRYFLHSHCRSVAYNDYMGPSGSASTATRNITICHHPGRPPLYQLVRLSLYMPGLARIFWRATVGGVIAVPVLRGIRF